MNNPNNDNPHTNLIKNLSEEPRGFIFGTYSAAKEDYPKDKSLITNPNKGYAYLSSTVGGSTSILSFEETYKGNRVSLPKNPRGGIRGKITGFSKASRLTLLRLLASIDYTSFEGKVFFVSLTYSEVWPEDPKVCKKHLEAFRKRMQRKFGDFPAVWRLGIQGRGAWHFHLLLFVPSSFGSLKDLRSFVSTAWYEVCGKVSEGHLLAGTNVEEIRSRKRVDHAGRYFAKKEKFPEGVQTGRPWGYWNKKLLPISWETLKISLDEACKIRRVFRRLAKKKGTRTLRKLQVFVRHENIVRLLEFLRDDKEWPKGARRPLPLQSALQKASGSRRNKEN